VGANVLLIPTYLSLVTRLGHHNDRQ